MNDETGSRLPDDFTSLLIAIPNVSGDMRTELSKSLIMASVLMTNLEIPFGVHWVIGSSAVERARNSIIDEFLRRKEFSHCLMIDDDMDFPHTDILKILSNKHEVCYAAGVKKMPGSDLPPQFAIYPLGRENPVCPDCGCVEMLAGGACFMLVSRKAIERMVEAFPDLWYVAETDPNERIYGLFNPYIEPDTHVYNAEDVAFYKRWRSIGGQVWLDTTIHLGHWGAARWSGDIEQSFTFKGDEKKG